MTEVMAKYDGVFLLARLSDVIRRFSGDIAGFDEFTVLNQTDGTVLIERVTVSDVEQDEQLMTQKLVTVVESQAVRPLAVPQLGLPLDVPLRWRVLGHSKGQEFTLVFVAQLVPLPDHVLGEGYALVNLIGDGTEASWRHDQVTRRLRRDHSDGT